MAEEAASWNIVFSDSQENPSSMVEVANFHTTQTSSAAKAYPSDRDALALPRMPTSNVKVINEGKVIIQVKGDAVDIIESEESDGQIPIVLTNLATGAKTHIRLRVGDVGRADFSGFNSTNDITLNTTSFVRLGAFQIPAGHSLQLDAGQPVHLFLGDDT